MVLKRIGCVINFVLISIFIDGCALSSNESLNPGNQFASNVISPKTTSNPSDIKSDFKLVLDWGSLDAFDVCHVTLKEKYERALDADFDILSAHHLLTANSHVNSIVKTAYLLRPKKTGYINIDGARCGYTEIKNVTLKVSELADVKSEFDNIFETVVFTQRKHVEVFEALDFKFVLKPKVNIYLDAIGKSPLIAGFEKNISTGLPVLLVVDKFTEVDGRYEFSGSLIAFGSGVFSHSLLSMKMRVYKQHVDIFAAPDQITEANGPILSYEVDRSSNYQADSLVGMRRQVYEGDINVLLALVDRLVNYENRAFEAFFWLNNFADKRSDLALMAGDFYYWGIGTKPSCGDAVALYTKALKLGSVDAKSKIEAIWDGEKCIGFDGRESVYMSKNP